MDTKISSAYWAHRQVEAAPPEIKFAGLWMLTNSRVMLFGYAEVTPERFAFETGLPKEGLARAIEALSEHFIRTARGYFIPNFIGQQIGRGDPLLANYVCKPLVRALVALHDEEISALVLKFYPELEVALKIISSPKPLPSPSQGEEQSRVEQSRAEQSRDQGKGSGERDGPPPSSSNGRRPPPIRRRTSGQLPESQPEPKRGRMLTLNQIFRRPPTDLWSEPEQLALEASGLLGLHELDFTDAAETVRAFYHAPIPREMEARFRKRTTIEQLLTHWGGELDKARTWSRERDDGVRKVV
jgi:hypothetical protein